MRNNGKGGMRTSGIAPSIICPVCGKSVARLEMYEDKDRIPAFFTAENERRVILFDPAKALPFYEAALLVCPKLWFFNYAPDFCRALLRRKLQVILTPDSLAVCESYAGRRAEDA